MIEVDTVKWCDEQLKAAIEGGRKEEAEAYARLKELWEQRSASQESANR